MLKISKLTHVSKSSTKSKNKHKDANSPKHKEHAKYRDPQGTRNAPSDNPPSKIWYQGVPNSEAFVEARIKASTDSRGRKRKLVGYAIVLSFPNHLVAYFNALPYEDKDAILEQMDVFYLEMLNKQFPGPARTDARHTDKHRPHYESYILKYDPGGEIDIST